MGRLDDKVFVVTGAASGIGAETARRFGEEGAIVVGADLRDDGVGTVARAVDVADEEQVAALFRGVREEFGRVDVLFNNAGISPTDDASVLETSLDAWQRVQDVNLKSVFLCCKHGIPHLIDAGDAGALASEELDRRRSDPAGRAGDDAHLAFEPSGHHVASVA